MLRKGDHIWSVLQRAAFPVPRISWKFLKCSSSESCQFHKLLRSLTMSWISIDSWDNSSLLELGIQMLQCDSISGYRITNSVVWKTFWRIQFEKRWICTFISINKGCSNDLCYINDVCTFMLVCRYFLWRFMQRGLQSNISVKSSHLWKCIDRTEFSWMEPKCSRSFSFV